ncbi:MAG: hypothetical protein WCN95_15125 [bacterium]
MKNRIIAALVLTLVFANAALSSDTNSFLRLEITMDHGLIMGRVRNVSTNAVRTGPANCYGHWEYTTVLYNDGKWREAPYTVAATNRCYMGGETEPVELKPGEILTQGLSFVGPAQTFAIDLFNYLLPSDVTTVRELRIVSGGLLSSIVNVENPSQNLNTVGTLTGTYGDGKMSWTRSVDKAENKGTAEPTNAPYSSPAGAGSKR